MIMRKILLICLNLLGIGAFAQNGFTTYTTNIAITSLLKTETALLVDNVGNKWIGFRGMGANPNVGLARYDNVNWTYYSKTSTPALPSNYVTALAKDNFGNIWIGTDSGLVKFNGTGFTLYNMTNGLPAKRVSCLDVIGNQVYVGTSAGLSRFDGANFYNYNVAGNTLPNDSITAIKAESSSLIWLGGNNRLVKFNINTTNNVSSFVDNLIATSPGTVNCIHIDSQNNKWLGTTVGGILIYNNSSFVNANSNYLIFGATIPSRVLDITTGPNNGVLFKAVSSSTAAALVELAPNGVVFQYFASSTLTTLGDFVENDNGLIVISQAGNVQPKTHYVFDKSMNVSQLGVVNVNNYKLLDINNVKAGISNRSDMHWDIGGSGNALYEVPKGSGKHSNFASALWIGGLDNNNQLHTSAQTYRQNGVDFWPGPLKLTDATTDSATSIQYDKIWKVSYLEINDFINNYNAGNVQNGTYTIPQDILTWPGNGDISKDQALILAPFEDVNGDAIYNPMDGDYPKIKGDQALFFIYNDNLSTHQATGGLPMGIEVHGMAYAYGCPSVLNGKEELAYTTFYDYKIINRTSTSYHNVYTTLWSDVDLGYYGDDYIGCNVQENYGYCYNGDSNDESISGINGYNGYTPAQGFAIMKAPLATLNDGIDNNNNGITDELNEQTGLNKFTYFNNSFAGIPVQTTDPSNSQNFYGYMTGYWKDGTPFTCGGNSYGGSVQTNYVFPGDPNGSVSSDQANTCGNWVETATPNDRRLLMSCGPFDFSPGEVKELEYAFVTSFDSSQANNSLLPLIKLKSDIQKVRAFYALTNKPTCFQSIATGANEITDAKSVSIYPNPAKQMVTVSFTQSTSGKINYQLVDVLGREVLNDETDKTEFIVDMGSINTGVYFLRLEQNNSIIVKKIVKD